MNLSRGVKIYMVKVRLKKHMAAYQLLPNKEYEAIGISEEGFFIINNELNEKSYYAQGQFEIVFIGTL